MRTAFLPLLLLCVGCVQHARIPATEVAGLAGVYRNGDGFWPRWLELREDGTFSYTQMTDVLKQSADGSMVFEGSWGLSGHWSFSPPDKIELSASGRPEKIGLFVRRSAKHEFAILEPDLFPDILKRWKDDGGWSYLKKAPKQPNKAPEPTSTSVTPRAILRPSEMKQRTEDRNEARVVPAVAVAHL